MKRKNHYPLQNTTQTKIYLYSVCQFFLFFLNQKILFLFSKVHRLLEKSNSNPSVEEIREEYLNKINEKRIYDKLFLEETDEKLEIRSL